MFALIDANVSIMPIQIPDKLYIVWNGIIKYCL